MKHFLLLVLVCIAAGAAAQPGERMPKEHRGGQRPTIDQIVSNLSESQKARIDLITARSGKTIEFYRVQLKAVRDSIRSYMSSPDDNSVVLFPLYEREGMLMSEISKEYYRSKVAIDEVLTPEQYREMQEKMAKNRHAKRKSATPPPAPRDRR